MDIWWKIALIHSSLAWINQCCERRKCSENTSYTFTTAV